ncbi:hypothetical protein [Amycolatopsis sp. YIM 10]|nr:hypothetical protein [Amycolatopsis sp. YIM 10]
MRWRQWGLPVGRVRSLGLAVGARRSASRSYLITGLGGDGAGLS